MARQKFFFFLFGPLLKKFAHHWSKAWVYVARLQGLRVRIPPGAWMTVSCDCYVLSGRGLCVELITRREESYSGANLLDIVFIVFQNVAINFVATRHTKRT